MMNGINNKTYKINNFDLLRLIAALQVAVNHSVEMLHVHPPMVLKNFLHFSQMFPGVPIFFFISGFLISKSYESNHKLVEYFQNRILRLYPGLIICVSFSFILIYVSGYLVTTNASAIDWLALYFAKTSILQFYNPDFMRAYGDGVLNGSLWTITVEIQFYILVPVIYSFFKLLDTEKHNLKLILLIIFFLFINRIYAYIPDEYHNNVLYKLFRVSFLPWFYMFLFGVLAQKNFTFFYKLLANKFIHLFIIYCIVGYLSQTYKIALGNNINPIVFLILVSTAFSFSYSFAGLSKTLLKGNDISYGTYIYHMPIVNFMIYLGYTESLDYAIYALIITTLLAVTSWLVIEKRSLSLKKHPLNPFKSSGTK
ncbi:MAG: acyltransferase [Gammaproteobacteria bacterium]|nr:acyltransferase [Gammaproteobacteria bacterium]